MRRGKQWPIPQKELIDGSSLALRNADRLIKDARVAYDNKRFSIALALSVLALEEFGKCLLLWQVCEKNRTVTADIWHNEFEDHKTKLGAILRILTSFPITSYTQAEAKKEYTKLGKLLQKWQNRKMEGIYLDWDAGTGKWHNYDDKLEEEKKKDAQEVLVLTERWLKIFAEELGDLPFATSKEVAELFRQGKVHCICRDCGTVMMNKTELVNHSIMYPSHLGRWFRN